jgi:hypothetical protein
VHVDLSVEGALVVDHVLDIGDVEPPGRHIRAHKEHTFVLADSASEVNSLALQFKHSVSEPIQILESLSLLHFAVQTVVFNLEALQNIADSLCAGDTVAEYDSRLPLVLAQEVVQVKVFFFFLAPDCEF